MYASIGIDLGSDRTRIYSGDSVVLDLPSCVAIKNHSSEAFAFGEEAQKKIDFLRDQIAIKDKQIEWMHELIQHKDHT